MPNYRRAYQPGGTFFFTVVTHQRQKLFQREEARKILHGAIVRVQTERPFEMPAIVLLPEHLHCIWKLPESDADFSRRWGCIKKYFTQSWLKERCAVHTLPGTVRAETNISKARREHRERGVWQKRFWEHRIRDEDDYMRHVNYIHYNPVKHQLVDCPHQWSYSSFTCWLKDGYYNEHWLCSCNVKVEMPSFDDIQHSVGE
jgi:REP-associated tyrosine transposase